MDHIIGFGVKGISRTIAVASEALTHNKKSQEYDLHNTDAHESSSDDEDYTSLQQDLDETAEREELDHNASSPPSYSELDPNVTADEVSEEYLTSHQDELAIQSSFTPRPIPKAVLLPQRRPRDRRRGFVRAYAPILGEYSGISQDMFLDFITNWDKAAVSSPIFNVINVACFGLGFVPHPICIAVSTAVGTANMYAQILQIQYKSNRYLERMNEKLFKPRGLFAMVMAYKPEMADQMFLQADVSNPTSLALTKAAGDTNKMKKIVARFKKVAGEVKDDSQIPECANLVYPKLDRAIAASGNSSQPSDANSSNSSGQQQLAQSDKQKSQLARRAQIINDYLDRRAQANFVATDPNSKISKALPPQEKKFVNRFADPDHPVNSGSLFGLVTGGTWDPIAMGRVRRAQNAARKKGQPALDEQEQHDAYMGRKVRGRVTGTPSKNTPVLSKLFKHDALYLIIVNLPSEQEMAEALRILKEGVPSE